MPDITEQRKLAAIMFTDMVGYSALAQRNDKLALELLEEQRALLREIFPEFNGTEIKTIGDAFLVEFQSALEAAQCAIEIQRALAKRNADAPAGRQIEVRIGIHIGDVVHRGGDVYGDGVNIASRIEPLAGPGGICVSMDVERQIRNALEARFEKLAPAELKNISVPMDLFRIVLPWERQTASAVKSETRGGQSGSDKSETRKSRSSHVVRWAGIVIVLLLVVGLGGWFIRQSKEARKPAALAIDQKSIAVLPFENLSRDPDNAYFADGIQEEILTRLSKIADLKVISRTSTQHFKSTPENLPAIARQLGVAHVLEGSVQKAADQVRVNVQLINAVTDSHLWAEGYDRKLNDIFAVESEIAGKIAETLQAKLSGAEQKAVAGRPTESAEAHELYLKGRHFVAKRTDDDLKRGIDYFNQALAKDPGYALAYAGIANAYALLQMYSNLGAAEVLPKARLAAEKALAIDNSLAEGHAALALILEGADFDLDGARREFERAIELNPNSSDSHYFFAISVLAPLGEFDRAITEAKRALALDPLSTIINTNLGHIYMLARRYPEAVEQLHKTIELDPNFSIAHGILGISLWLNGDTVGAKSEYEKGHSLGKLAHSPMDEAIPLAFLANLYGLSGQHDKALEVNAEFKAAERRLGRVLHYPNAIAQIGLGDKEQAIGWLERGFQARETGAIEYIKFDPMLDPLRGNSRFETLVQKIIGEKAVK